MNNDESDILSSKINHINTKTSEIREYDANLLGSSDTMPIEPTSVYSTRSCQGPCPEPLPDDICVQLQSRKFVGYLVISTVALAIVAYVISTIIGNYMYYTKGAGFPYITTFIGGTVFSFILLAYIVYNLTSQCPNSTLVYWVYLIFLLAYILWSVNLALRTETYVKGAAISNNGTFYLLLANLCVLVILYYSVYISHLATFLSILVMAWMLYILWNWWFRLGNNDRRQTPRRCK